PRERLDRRRVAAVASAGGDRLPVGERDLGSVASQQRGRHHRLADVGAGADNDQGHSFSPPAAPPAAAITVLALARGVPDSAAAPAARSFAGPAAAGEGAASGTGCATAPTCC